MGKELNKILAYICDCKSDFSESTKISPKALVSGNKAYIKKYLEENKANLNARDIEYLNNRLEVIDYINELKAEQKNTKYTPNAGVEIPNGYILTDTKLEKQSSENGCWAMPITMMLRSRGINISQEVIRANRPEIPEDYDENKIKIDTALLMNKDTKNNISMGADIINKLVPNVAMRQRKYGCHNMTSAQKKLFTDDMRNTVIESLKKGCPVGFLFGEHYTTIVGIEGDTVLFKDSYNDAKRTNVDTANEIHSATFDEVMSIAKKTRAGSVELTWLEDLPVKDGVVDVNAYTSKYPCLKQDNNQLSCSTAELEKLSNDKITKEGILIESENNDNNEIFNNSININATETTGIKAGITDTVILPKSLDPTVKTMDINDKWKVEEKNNELEKKTAPVKKNNSAKEVASAKDAIANMLLNKVMTRLLSDFKVGSKEYNDTKAAFTEKSSLVAAKQGIKNSAAFKEMVNNKSVEELTEMLNNKDTYRNFIMKQNESEWSKNNANPDKKFEQQWEIKANEAEMVPAM